LAQARKMLSERVRDAAFDAYVKDERDTATPKGMVSFLYALASGNLLAPESNKFLLEVMRRTTTFPDRLEAGTPPGWHLGHKTGTSPTWKGMTAATNDVGILTAPDGSSVALAAFIAESRRDEKERAALFATAARATAAAFR
jgi:beta-lactamase class A